jgi:hypothetical protein
MKSTKFFFFLLTISAIFLFVECKPREENKIPPNCFDGELNNGEVKIDCGGPNCEECDHCANGVWEPSRGETWLDCGGPCPICPTCRNGVLDDGESGIDCGGDCGGCELLCGDGLLNGYEDQIDCDNESDVLQGGCEYCPTCVDGIMNGNETGIDCGGDSCQACCSTGSCRNGIRDGEEFFNDCGGNICEDCPDTLYWSVNDTMYYTPSFAIVYSEGPVITFTANQGFPTDPESQFMPMGTLDLLMTEPPAPSSWSQLYNAANSTIQFPNTIATSDLYYIFWTDALGNSYSTANQTLDGLEVGSGTFTLEGYDTIVIPDDNFDGCNKPAGTYTYYRVLFNGVLVTNDLFALVPSVEVSGRFVVTKFVP